MPSAQNCATTQRTRGSSGTSYAGAKMSDAAPSPDFDMGRLSVLLELTQRLSKMQQDEQAAIDRFVASRDHPGRLAMSESMARIILIGELLDWANENLEQAQQERRDH